MSATDGFAAPGARRLDALTSLRFFAAMMIVGYHAAGMLGIGHAPVNLGHGVSFFFVLSGFILAYVYPRLDTAAEVRGFWRARIARIWPAHIATLVLGAVLVGYPWSASTLAANVLLVHAWIPMSAFYFAYNAVSWSISTELFFYLAFPWLNRRWERTGTWKLAGAVLAVLALIAACAALALPWYFEPTDPVGSRQVTSNGLLYISPLARLLEFTAGIAMAKSWLRQGARALPGPATAWELGAIAACAGWLWALPRVTSTYADRLGPTALEWLENAGAFPFFALLIYVVAPGRGAISRVLALPGLVLLGEISYSLYLVHQILQATYRFHAAQLPPLPDALAASLLLGILLLVSYLLWRWVELPARRWLLGARAPHAGTPPKGFGLSRRAPVFASLALVALLLTLRFAGTLSVGPDQAVATVAGTRFGDATTLHEVRMQCLVDGVALRLRWSGPATDPQRWMHPVHVVADGGAIVRQFDYPPDPESTGPDGTRVDTVYLPYDALRTGVAIGLGLYDLQSGRLLPVDGGRRDLGGRRLLIDLPACAVPDPLARPAP
jgi:peptidoglycan/LPS O-acetylase OafA/YrhL